MSKRPHPDEQSCIKPLPVLDHEFFLLRRTEANPKNVRLQFRNLAHQGFFFLQFEAPKWRVEHPDNLDPGEPRFEPRFELLRYSWGSPIQKVSEAAGLGQFAYSQHQIRAVNTTHLAKSL